MFYPSTAGSVTSFVTPHYPSSRGYYPAPMSAVMPGQHYYPTMHAPMSAPLAYPQQYGYASHATMPYYGHQYGHQPTVIISSPSRRHHHRRSRSRGFLGYL